MYYSNFISSPKGYFHTVVCIPEEFKNSNMNHDLHSVVIQLLALPRMKPKKGIC
jgi:hypothetical protein